MKKFFNSGPDLFTSKIEMNRNTMGTNIWTLNMKIGAEENACLNGVNKVSPIIQFKKGILH